MAKAKETQEKELKKIALDDLLTMNYRDVIEDFFDIKESMLERGQLEALNVTPEIKDGAETGKYIIVNGERRFRAAKNIIASNIETKFDFSKLDCIIDKSYNLDTNSEGFKLNQLILNEVHKSTTFDTYLAVKALVESKKYNKTQISKALGKDDTWAGKIANLIIDNDSFRCFFSGAHLFYNSKTGDVYNSESKFCEAMKDVITEKDKERLGAFLRSKETELSNWEKDNQPLFENQTLKNFIILKGFGEESAPSIFGAAELVKFFNDYCIEHARKIEAIGLFNRMIRTLLGKRKKTKKDIDSLVNAIREKYFENTEPEKTKKESNEVTPADMAKRIFNLFKDLEFSDDQIKEIKKELRFLLKDPKHKERIKVDISFALKQTKEETENENA
ncbi:MAG TPA: ParB/Srx family N-terminal domain-containing protein [bacterium]|nr:ParB/Srx family N-terminal domain-containing protein [bacterium]